MMRPWPIAAGVLIMFGIAGCLASSARPGFAPMPAARSAEVELDPIEAIKLLAENLQDAGVPVATVAPQDGYFETQWFDTTSKQPAGSNALGPQVVRIRGWATPSRHGWSTVTVETVFRAAADPSRPPRELERSVTYTHPTRQLVRQSFADVGITTNATEFGAPEAVAVRPPTMDPGAVPRPPVKLDTAAARPQAPAARDSTPAPRDSQPRAPAPVSVDTLPRTPTPLDTPTQPDTSAPAEPAHGYAVQVAAATDSATAAETSAQLARIGLDPRIVKEGGYWKVRTQLWNAQPFADVQLAEIRKTFGDAFVVRE